MPSIVVGIVDKPLEAQRLIDELMSRCLCDRENISVVAQGTSTPGADMVQEILRRGTGIAAGTAKAATAAAGGAVSAAAGMVSRLVPDFGVMNAAGPLASALANAGLKTLDGLAGALAEAGAAQDRAREYAEALRRGGILVAVQPATENMARCAGEIMRKHGAVAHERVAH